MSCHDIGRGLNQVVREIIDLFDKEEISKEAARKIISTCCMAVNWCDGNEYEAIDHIIKCRCGRCLKLVPKGERLYSIWDFPYGFADEKDIDIQKLGLASPGICDHCFNEVMNKFSDGNRSVNDLKEMIINNTDSEEDYTSEGEPPVTNNGCPWRHRIN